MEGRHYLSVSWVGVTAINPMEGTPFQGKIADFSASNRDADDFSASIDWGDGSARFYDTAITKTSGGHFAVDTTAPHVFRHATTVTVRVYAKDDIDNGEKSGVATIHVSNAPIVVTINSLSLTKGVAFSGQVASFTTGNLDATATSYTGTIAWGDGASTTGTVTQQGEGQFTLTGNHTYTTTGSMPFSITVNGPNSNSSGAVSATQNVPVPADPVLDDTNVSIDSSVNEPYAGELTRILDTDGTHSAGSYSGTVNWGDGSSSAVTITAASTGVYSVSGSHTYTSWGDHTLSFSITGPNGTLPPSTRDIAVAANPMGVAPVLTVSGKTASSVTLSWTGADGSDLQLEIQGPYENYHFIQGLGNSNGTYTVAGLRAGETYAFRIRAIAGELSSYGSLPPVTTLDLPTIYSAPTNLAWSANGTLGWDWAKPSGVDEVAWVVEASSAESPAHWATFGPGILGDFVYDGNGHWTTTYVDWPWADAQFRVHGWADINGPATPWSAKTGAMPTKTLSPDSPDGVTSSYNSDTDTITVSWNAVDNADYYQLVTVNKENPTMMLGDQVVWSGTNLTATVSRPQYDGLAVQAVSVVNGYDRLSGVTKFIDSRTPAALTGLKAYYNENGKITSVWNNIGDNEAYDEVQFTEDNGLNWLAAGSVPPDVDTMTDIGPASGIPKREKMIRARHGNENGIFSPWATATAGSILNIVPEKANYSVGSRQNELTIVCKETLDNDDGKVKPLRASDLEIYAHPEGDNTQETGFVASDTYNATTERHEVKIDISVTVDRTKVYIIKIYSKRIPSFYAEVRVTFER